MLIKFVLIFAILALVQCKATEIVDDCMLSEKWCTRGNYISVRNPNASPLWGTFRPGTYFGMKTRSNGSSIATGIMWSSSLSEGKNLRDQTQQDELTQFEWLRHDGRRFGVEKLLDNAYDMNIEASFVIPEPRDDAPEFAPNEHVPEWFQKLSIGSSNSMHTEVGILDGNDKKSLVFYFGTDCVGKDTAECLTDAEATGWKVNKHAGSQDRGFDNAVSIIGHSDVSGWFCLFLIVKQQVSMNATDLSSRDGSTVSVAGLSDVNLLQGVERLKRAANLVRTNGEEEQHTSSRRRRKQMETLLFDDFGDLNDEVSEDASFIAVHVGFTGSVRVDAVLYAHLDVSSSDELTDLIDEAESQGKTNVLPFSMSTALTISHRSLIRNIVPTGTSTPRASAVVESTGESTPAAMDGAATTSKAGDEAVAEKIPSGPLTRVHCGNQGDCIRSEVDQLLEKYNAAFDDHFSTVFPLESANTFLSDNSESVTTSDDSSTASNWMPAFTEKDIEAAKVCLSSVLGGMGYFQGRPSIGVAFDVEMDSGERALSKTTKFNQLVKLVNDKSSLVSLFSATPSRTSFPRGFLWDEGFHQMLISQWNPALSMDVISSWLNAMHFPCDDAAATFSEETSTGSTDSRNKCVGGWIPREMILGEEAKSRVPDEFVVQRVNIANPPTFLLVVENLLDRFESATPPRRSTQRRARNNQRTQQDELPVATGSALQESSEELKSDELHGDSEVMRRYRKTIDPRDAQLVLVQHSAERDTVLTFLRDVYPQLHRWVQWYLHSQRGSDARPGSFRWRGRSQSDGKVIPNTLSSGLDDYPRAPIASTEEHHVDLHCWMTKAVGVMARLERVLEKTGFALPPSSEALALKAQYQHQHDYLLQRLDELHWSAEHHGFFDVGINNEDAAFSQEIVFRCSNPRDQSSRDVSVPIDAVRKGRQDFCPASHPKPMFPLGDGQGNYKLTERLLIQNPTLSHIPRVGYVAIFPLLLRLLDPYSPKLGSVLDMVEDPQMLWTDHGLRSIGLKDKFYQRRNSEGDAPYWRGPIWIPINYLALGSLHHYAGIEGVFQARAQHLYDSLRENVLQTVLSQYASTGFFWEQYDDSTGAGIRGHPFTGWTALVVNIMAEKY